MERLIPWGRNALGSVLAVGLLSAALPAQAQTCSSVSQHGIVFTFDRAYACGQFANGDHWVAPDTLGATVVVTSITPSFNGTEHGWEVNPADPIAQGFDSRIFSYESSRVPTLPYSARGGDSIVKGVSVASGDCRPCLATAAVLTVLDAVPVGGGGTLLRPPYAGPNKPLYDTTGLRVGDLPELAPTASAPTLAEMASALERPWLDHKEGWTGRPLHPEENMPDYGAAIASLSADAALALLLEGPATDKHDLAVRIAQIGVDLFAAYEHGTRWEPNGGHSSGRKLLIALAGWLLGASEFEVALRGAPSTDFGEDGSVVSGSGGLALWGQPCSETNYWNYWRFGSGAKSCLDPYGHIDGGIAPGGSYQFCCNSAPWRGHALTVRLLPELQCGWPVGAFLTYVDRWVETGTHSQPDPCAGYDGDPDNYGMTYGPDGSGGCILDTDATDGIGRFPEAHGTNANGGHYGSAFQSEMWAAYRESATGVPSCDLMFADRFETGDTSGWSQALP